MAPAAPIAARPPGRGADTVIAREARRESHPTLCLDCLTATSAPAGRCAACGSPRVVSHPELDRLCIAHLDCDAFYAAIEKRDDPSLADKPVIVGGGKRGVVSTACYIARIHGVRSAMPMFKALKACPDAVVIRPDMEKYAEGRPRGARADAGADAAGRAGLDRRGLPRSRRHRAAPPRQPRFVARPPLPGGSRHEIGITVSIGLSFNKFLAKIASDLRKPRGFSVIGEGEAVASSPTSRSA